MVKRVQKIIDSNIFFMFSLVFLGWFIASDNASRMIGQAFPVVSKLTVETVVPYQVGLVPGVKITGFVEKNRDCDFSNMRWFAQDSGIEGTAQSYFLDAPRGNEKGLIAFTGIIVGITPERLPVARSEVVHRCAFGVKVISEFYEGEDL